MKRINIYLTKEEKNELEKIARKYKCSISTIADKVCTYTYYVLTHGQGNEILFNQYLAKGIKTSIKPKCYDPKENPLANTIENKDMFTTNCLKIYVAKNIGQYLENKEYIQVYWNKINRDLMQVKEQFWNYNNFIRSTMRSFKENKDYYKRKLEQMEQR